MRTFTVQLRQVLGLLKQALLGTEKRFTSGGINRSIILLAVPTVMELVMESIFVCANLFFVSKLGAGAISLVGSTESIITFSYSVAIGLSMAATALVSRRVGEGRFRRAALTALQVVYLGVAFSMVITCITVIWWKEILSLLGLPSNLLHYGADYVRLMFASTALIIVRMAINGVLRGAGDAAIAMRTLWLSNAANILLCPLLIFGWGPVPALGITGLAWATLLARALGLAYQCLHLLGGRSVIRFGNVPYRIDRPTMQKVLQLTASGTIQYIVPSSSWLFMIKIVAHFGPTALAGYILAQRISSIATMPAWGVGNAAGILTGQNLGAGQPERAERSVWRAGTINMCFLVLVALFWFFYANKAASFFSDLPAVVQETTMYMQFISIAYILLGYTMVISRSLNAAGEIAVVTRLYLLMFYGVQIPLSYLLGIYCGMGPKGVFLAIMLAELVLAGSCIYVFRKGDWKLKNV